MLNFNVSVIIPVFNEAKNISPLVVELDQKLKHIVQAFEIVIVNDGSSDNTQEVVNNLKKSHNITYLENKENLGQGRTILKGMKIAANNILITMDGDLQVEPNDIETMLWVKQKRNLDFVCSKRKKRAGDPYRRHIPSVLGNFLISILFNSDFSDIGSSLKVLEKSAVENLKPFKNIHRYLNVILERKGLSYVEIPVTDRKRLYGKSNYNFTKFFEVLIELIYLKIYIRKLVK